MDWLDTHILSVTVFLPLAGALLLLLLPRSSAAAIRGVAFGISLLVFLISTRLYFRFDAESAGFQFVERHLWIPGLGDRGFLEVYYHFGIDGISLFLFLLTTFLSPIVIAGAWREITVRVRQFMVAMLFLETAMLGTFAALNGFLFYVFWESILIPMYLIIGVWGGPRRVYAAVKFIIYTLVGSLLMLIALLYLYHLHNLAFDRYSFEIIDLYRVSVPFWPGITSPQALLFLAFGLAFAIKVPMFPFHTWLPDAHVEAPTAGSVILAAVLLKMGTYGFVRFSLPLFPEASVAFAKPIAVLALIGIIYGALVAMVQRDVKKLVAYSSVSHLGFVMLGIFALNRQGLEGGLLQMINHGLSTGALFLLVGMIYERRHTRMIGDFGGLAKTMPLYAAFFVIIALSSIGLPGLNGFVGEFLILLGAYEVGPGYVALAALGVILAAAYMLWMVMRIFFGPLNKDENRGLLDLSRRELAILVVIVIPIVWIGIYPKSFLGKMRVTVEETIKVVRAHEQAEVLASSAPVVEPEAPEDSDG